MAFNGGGRVVSVDTFCSHGNELSEIQRVESLKRDEEEEEKGRFERRKGLRE